MTERGWVLRAPSAAMSERQSASEYFKFSASPKFLRLVFDTAALRRIRKLGGALSIVIAATAASSWVTTERSLTIAPGRSVAR